MKSISAMLYIYHKKQLVKCQHKLVANDIKSAIACVSPNDQQEG